MKEADITQVISCSALVLDEQGARVLISRRSENRRIAPGLWEVIGGKLEFGEEPEACLRREIHEELNVVITSPALFQVYSCMSEIDARPVHLVSIVYTCRIEGEPAANPKEIAALRWVGPDDLEGLQFAANCRERVEDYFRMNPN